MKQVLCTLPDSPLWINGIEFQETDDGVLSKPIPDYLAEQFITLDGYTLLDAEGEDAPRGVPSPVSVAAGVIVIQPENITAVAAVTKEE